MPSLTEYVDTQFSERELNILAGAVLFETDEERRTSIAKIVTWAGKVRTNADILHLILSESVLVDFDSKGGVLLIPIKKNLTIPKPESIHA